MKILTNDKVQVMAGKDKGKTWIVKKTLKDRVVVEGVNLVTKHVKGREGQSGQKIKVEASLHVSNVMAICPKSKKPSRLWYSVSKNGEKVRIAKKSWEVVPNTMKKKS